MPTGNFPLESNLPGQYRSVWCPEKFTPARIEAPKLQNRFRGGSLAPAIAALEVSKPVLDYDSGNVMYADAQPRVHA